MDFAGLYAALARRLGERDDLIPYMEFERDLAIARLEKLPEKPWFLESEMAEAATTAGEGRLPVPYNFLREIEDHALWLKVNDVWVALEKDDYDSLFERYGEYPGIPEKYAIVGRYFALFPIPDDAYPVKMRYYGRQDADVWLQEAPELLMAEMGVQMAGKYLHNPDLALMFETDRKEALERLAVEQVAREEVNRDRTMK